MVKPVKPAKEFLVHVELHGLFSAYVYPSPSGSSIVFFPFPATEKNFPDFLASRFGHLGQPSDLVLDQDTKAYRVEFPGLRFASPEEALSRLVKR